ADMHQVRRRKRPNRPHIPSSSSMSKSNEDKKKQARQSPSDPASIHLQIPEPNRSTAATQPQKPSPFRFGEPLSREHTKNPQEENAPAARFFSTRFKNSYI
ncbi:hypothetical protein, partial [Cereibacter ovatus]|uniref:hypothetical protein n=1 Tax=Cereibacter ovatus TaxID=439529 RepID=UPI0019596A7C